MLPHEQEQEITLLEGVIVGLVVRQLVNAVNPLTRLLTRRWGDRLLQPLKWEQGRREVAARLRLLDVKPSHPLRRLLGRAVRLGAVHIYDTRPTPRTLTPKTHMNPRMVINTDTLITDTLHTIDGRVDDMLTVAADRIATNQINTQKQLDSTIHQMTAPIRYTQTTTETLVTRAVAAGAMSTGASLVWVAERDACLVCLSYAGATNHQGMFKPTKEYTPTPGLIVAPPAHPRCRCRVQAATEGVAAGLKREAERSVAYGWSPDALPDRLAALNKVLTSAVLPAHVKQYAANSKTTGVFGKPRTARVPKPMNKEGHHA